MPDREAHEPESGDSWLADLLPRPLSFFGLHAQEPLPPLRGLEAGKTFGDFRLIALLGQGGMGQVWEAEQLSLGGRRVALKVVRPDRLGEKQLAYFEREARAGARLSHPGIVAVHGYGEVEGLAWIAMELVEGTWNLRDFLDAVARREALPEDYDRDVASFLHEVAEAVHAAHAAGVIHRDLKPQNILITKDEHPKVTDFGLARITDESALSQSGDVAGTYLYMSPEQVAASRQGIDHRTDVFSLGVVMYEMLALSRPFQGDTSQQVAYQIAMQEPPSLTSIRSRIPRDLVVLCGKALEKERGRRYATMGDLAEDLRRFLNHEPILAQPPGAPERLRKWVRRNPAKSLAGSVAGLAFAAISVVLVLYARTNEDLRLQAIELATKTIEAESRSAELQTVTEFQAAMFEGLDFGEVGASIVEGMRTDLREGLMRGEGPPELANASLDRFDGLTASLNPTDMAAELVDQIFLSRAVEAIGAEFGDQPRVEAALRSTAGRLYQSLGLYEPALPQFERVVELRRGLFGPGDYQTLDALNDTGLVLSQLGRLAEAETYLVEALAGRATLENPPPDSAAFLSNMGQLRSLQTRYEEALSYEQAALEEYRARLGSGASQSLTAMGNVGTTLWLMKRNVEAEPYLRDALAGHRKRGVQDYELLSAIGNLGSFLTSTESYEESETLLLETLERRRSAFGENHPLTLNAASNLTALYFAIGRLEEARPLCILSLEGRRATLGDEHDSTLMAMNNLASVHQYLKEYQLAESLFRELLRISQRIHGPDHPNRILYALNLGTNLAREGRLVEAEPYFRQALDARVRTLGSGHQDVATSKLNYGALLKQLKRTEEAEDFLRQGLEAARNVPAGFRETTLRGLGEIGDLLREEQRWEEAEPYSRETLPYAREGLPPRLIDFLGIYFYNHGYTLFVLGRFAEARDTMLEGLELVEERLGEDAPNRILLIEGLSDLYGEWRAVEPESGHDESEREWRALLPAANEDR